MSLHFIGIRDFPGLQKQLTSPTSRGGSPSSVQDLAHDSRDVLIQRLNDLALRLTTEEGLRDEDVTVLHNEMDHMEKTMQTSAWSHQNVNSIKGKNKSSIKGKSVGSSGSPRTQEDSFWSPFSPKRKASMRLPDSLLKTSHSKLQKALEMPPKQIALVAQEAESLHQKLQRTVQELQARKEEIGHIHDLLVTRAEKAAQRIIDLESHVKDLDAEFEASQSELSFLRIQLQAIEAQGLQYITVNVDEELSESIKNWKRDLADLDQKTKVRGRRCKEVLVGLKKPQTAVDVS